jgi:CheY-like chemotaxis protein
MERPGEPDGPDAASAGQALPCPLRVVVVDDSVAYGLLVSAWFGGDAEIDVVAAVRTEHEALATLTAVRPDAVMLDHLLPGEEHSGRVLDHIRAELPDAAVILVSGMPADHLAIAAAAAGADHHVSKAANARAISEAIHIGFARRVRDR